MSMNILNDISKVYMEQVASKPDFLDLDKDGNKKESMKKASKEVEAPKERLKTDRNMFSIPKGEQEAARERLLAKARAKREKMKESLDPVGQEDSDIDNDGDTDSSDKYLHKRRKAIGKAIAKKSVKESSYYDPMDDDDFDHDEAEENRGVSGKNNPKGGKALGKKKKNMKEGFSNWRQDLSEVMDDIEANKEIKEKKVNNKIKINPEMKEAVEQLGGELVEMVELDEKTYNEGLFDGSITRTPSKVQSPQSSPIRKTPSKIQSGPKINQTNSYQPEGELVDEKMNMKKSEMGDVIKDFYKSDAPQFKGKSKEKRREMAIAAKLTAERGGKKLGEDLVTEKDEKIEAKFKGARTPFLLDKFRKEHPGSRQEKKKRGAKETPKERQSRLTNRQVERAVKYGLTKKEKRETQGREKYYSSRD